ncbi:hypothetical protein PORUE0001_0132 [Porphyromonas uenonis 60-3]|nr:hypothetical protein PORUE0001_0522 [Porphyromonas uenonis 60-3]EEK16809.1 hypothetical protein PORUE0001_0132 [Porphyromonas uenonis 60-3]
MGDDVKLSIKAKDGYRITFVASDPSGLLRPTRRTSSEAEYLINTSKHQEVEVLVHCTRQS